VWLWEEFERNGKRRRVGVTSGKGRRLDYTLVQFRICGIFHFSFSSRRRHQRL